jgi:tetratricopeptide (TPR) repeat protein
MASGCDDGLLDEIKTMFHDGETEPALELIDAYLDEYTDDMQAHLLKLEICIAEQRDTDYVGRTLADLRSNLAGTERYDRLANLVEGVVQEALAEGRHQLSKRSFQRDWTDIHEAFDLACELMPDDPSVPLAAAQALLGDDTQIALPQSSAIQSLARLLDTSKCSEEDDTHTALSQPSTVQSFIRLLNAPNRSEETEKRYSALDKYLKEVLVRSIVGEPARITSSRLLVHHWLIGNNMEEIYSCLDVVLEAGDASINEVARQTVYVALGVILRCLRSGETDIANSLLDMCSKVWPDAPLIHLIRAETFRLFGQHQQAFDFYQKALVTKTDSLLELDLQTAQAIWEKITKLSRLCPACSKVNTIQRSTCTFCNHSFQTLDLLADQYHLGDAPLTVVAQVGCMAYHAEQGHTQESLEYLEQALKELNENEKALATLLPLHDEWEAAIESNYIPSLAETVLSINQEKMTDEVVAKIVQLCENDQSHWDNIPIRTRCKLVRRLLKANFLIEARNVMVVALAEQAEYKSVTALAGQLNQAIASRVRILCDEAESALQRGAIDEAVQKSDAVFLLHEQNYQGMIVRGKARLEGGNELAALADFRNVIEYSKDMELVHEARLCTALVLEECGEIAEAMKVIEEHNNPDVAAIRTRLQRRQRNEPIIHIRATDSVVMQDTLERCDLDDTVHGFWAVRVQSVGLPTNGAKKEWMEQVLRDGYLFVETLGGLRHTEGAPTFALRMISTPHSQIPERGQLTIAFLVRVSAGDAHSSRHRALALWRSLKNILPNQDKFVFEPVFDETELKKLLEPFPVASVAEIVRRENTLSRRGDRYVVYPFTAGIIDLHGVCWALLRSASPAMLSIHLVPTTLMSWEQIALENMMLNGGHLARQKVVKAEGVQSSDSVSEWWQTLSSMGQVQTNRHLVNNLRTGAYIMGINVVTSDATGALLPAQIASSLFGSIRPVGDAMCGGYEIVRARAEMEWTQACRNISNIDVENWVFSSSPGNSVRLRHLVSEGEAALAFRLPIPDGEGLPGLPVIRAKRVPPPDNLPDRGVCLGESVMHVGGSGLRINQCQDDRRRHAYVVGKTGVGKSNLLKNLALQDICAGHGVCVIDPHGDLIDDMLPLIPDNRMEDVIVFDASDDEYPIGLNLLEARSESEKPQIVNEFIGLLVRMYDPQNTGGIVGPRFQHNVRNAMLTVMAMEGSTLIEVVRALTDIKYVKKNLHHVTDPIVLNYWEKQIANTSDFHKSEILDYIVSKFSRFIGDQRIRNIVGQRKTTVDFRKVMDERRILLVNLSKGKIGPENAQFLGLLLVQRLLLTSLGRADMAAEDRADFMLYVDEFQNFATKMFATVLSEGRKYGVSATVANQYLTQLDPFIREAIFGNIGTMVSFQLGTRDAKEIVHDMYPVFGVDDLLNLPKYTACVKLLVDGVSSRPFTMRTLLDLSSPNKKRAQRIRQQSRERYGRPAKELTQEVLERFQGRS